MNIVNPFSNYPMIRITSKTPKGDVVSVMSTRNNLEVPDGASEALIEPVKNGRPGAAATAQGRIWSPEWGVMEIEDHLKKLKIVEEEKALKVRLEKVDRERRPKVEKKVEKTEKAEKPVKKVVKVDDVQLAHQANELAKSFKKVEKKTEKVEKTENKDEKTSK